MKSLFAVIHVFDGCFWIYTWILVNVSYNIRYSSSKVALCVLAGEVPKQVKVKKLKNLKTLDSKPGNNFRVKLPVFSFKRCTLFLLWLYAAFFPLGVYTSYKPYLNKDEEIVKQLQKVMV